MLNPLDVEALADAAEKAMHTQATQLPPGMLVCTQERLDARLAFTLRWIADWSGEAVGLDGSLHGVLLPHGLAFAYMVQYAGGNDNFVYVLLLGALPMPEGAASVGELQGAALRLGHQLQVPPPERLAAPAPTLASTGWGGCASVARHLGTLAQFVADPQAYVTRQSSTNTAEKLGDSGPYLN